MNVSGADFSPCRRYRYSLWRRWDWQGYAQQVMFIGLNPSTADAERDDPTIRRCKAFAKAWGYCGMYMLNLYAYRATLPKEMVAADDPLGPGNLEAFGYYRSHVGLIVAAWGTLSPRYRPRVKWQSTIDQVLHAIGQPVYCLGRTADGSPRHPLYLPRGTERELYWHLEGE
jgi:hypothetical protein